jgi:hypothetical protein
MMDWCSIHLRLVLVKISAFPLLHRWLLLGAFRVTFSLAFIVEECDLLAL